MNSRPLRPERSALPTALYPEEKRQLLLPFGCGRRIRTLTIRVRVAGATITQFRIAYSALLVSRLSALLVYGKYTRLSITFLKKFQFFSIFSKLCLCFLDNAFPKNRIYGLKLRFFKYPPVFLHLHLLRDSIMIGCSKS